MAMDHVFIVDLYSMFIAPSHISYNTTQYGIYVIRLAYPSTCTDAGNQTN